MTSVADILIRSQGLAGQLCSWRQDLHRHPELAFQEKRTASVVADSLNALGLEVQTGVGRTGVVALLEGGRPGPTVMLRFDMDALPILEQTGLSFASEVPGRMHACGHDGHVAIGLGVATLLAAQQQSLAGRVKFLFQPAEEVARGARAMIDDGALEHPTPDIAFGLHLWSQVPLGRSIVRPGPLWAASDRFDVTITGRGSHGALPHEGVDAVLVSAYAIAQLQSVVSRTRDPLQPAVLSIGTLHGGSAFNILAEQVAMSGTLRTFDAVERSRIIDHMHAILAGVCAAHDGHYELTFSDYTPPVVNDDLASRLIRVAAGSVLGDEGVRDGPTMMVAEDMSEFLNRIPGCYFVLGAMKEQTGAAEPHHSPRFDIDERALPLGVAILTQATATYLQAGRN